MDTNKDIQGLSDEQREAIRHGAELLRLEGYQWQSDGLNAILATRQPAPAVGQQGGDVACAACNGEGWVRDIHDMEQGLIRCTKCAAHPPTDAAPAWDADATKRLRSIVDLLGLQSCVPEGDLTGYEFAVLGFVRREIERRMAKADAAPVDEKPFAFLSRQERHPGEWSRWFEVSEADYKYRAEHPLDGIQIVCTYAAQPFPAQGDALSQDVGDDCTPENIAAYLRTCTKGKRGQVAASSNLLNVAADMLAQRTASQPDSGRDAVDAARWRAYRVSAAAAMAGLHSEALDAAVDRIVAAMAAQLGEKGGV